MRFAVQQTFKLSTLLSENALSQSWLAEDPVSGSKRFVKIPSPNSPIGKESARAILWRSFDLQRRIKSSIINKAVRRFSDNGNLFIEYPHLSDSDWQDLSASHLLNRYPEALVQITEIIDYLHLLKLVHGDIKLENFRISRSPNQTRVLLCDLDFLTESNTCPDSRIFGTPGLIAPEIFRNEIVAPQSDSYSLGKSLLIATEQLSSSSSDEGLQLKSSLEKFKRTARVLTEDSRGSRPLNISETLYRYQIIDLQELRKIQRRLLGMKLIADFWELSDRLRKRQSHISDIISEQNNLIGIPREILESLNKEFMVNSVTTLKKIRRLLETAALERHGEFWQVELDDAEIRKVLQPKLGPARLAEGNNSIERISRNRVRKSVRQADKLRKEEQPLKAFYVLKDCYDSIEQDKSISADKESFDLIQELSALGLELGRIDETKSVLERGLSLSESDLSRQLQLLKTLVNVCLLKADYAAARGFITRGITIADNYDDALSKLAFNRQLASIEIFTTRRDSAPRILEELMQDAERLACYPELGRLKVISGLWHWKSGAFENAEKDFLAGLKLLQKSSERKDLIAPLGNLSMIYFEQAEYNKSVKFGKLAVSMAEGRSGSTAVSAVYSNLVLSYARLAEYNKARFWLQKYLSCARFIGNSSFYRNYYFLKGNLHLRMGELEPAKESLFSAYYLYTQGEKDRNWGKIYFNLALIAFYTGDKSEFEQCIGHAFESFEQIADKASLQESLLLRRLYAVVYEDAEPSILLENWNELRSLHCHYYAGVCLFHILAAFSGKNFKIALPDDNTSPPFLKRSPVPIFQAANELRSFHDGAGNISKNHIYLKIALKILLHSNDSFHASLICRRIGDFYCEMGKRRLALEYYEHARSIADNLRNSVMKEKITRQIDALPDTREDSARIVNVLSGISEILKNVTDYDLALTKLVEYAVDETGAERGVFLVRHEQKKDFYPKTYVNFDESDIADVRKISSHITDRVAHNIEPMIIANALQDERTKGFKSVMANNILSVICVPIHAEGEIRGVLYLDHHTIPALFKPQDILFINSIANFISSLYQTIQKFRIQDISARQLKQDLSTLGAGQHLITRNSKMKDLLSSLELAAKSNAPVLILGESGTGKELLAHLIHDLSFRSEKPLIKLNCAAIPATLMESELFGIARNVATGVDEREGKLSAADTGTLFLDEIADLPLEAQSKILRAIEYQEFEKVGSNRLVSTDIRYVAATNKEMKELVKTGKFREDLFYRINTITLQIPPLREREDDIPLLIEHFLSLSTCNRGRRPAISDSTMPYLMNYNWPGNVRELKNLVERLCILYPGARIEKTHLPQEIVNFQPQEGTARGKGAVDPSTLKRLLSENNWNKSAVSRKLNIPLSTLCRMLKKYDLLKPR